MTSPTVNTLIFPKIRRVVIQNLTVYSQRSTIELAFPDGVFCLAGANGLGKSTFIAAINFGLTGRIPEPTRSFQSVDEYYQQTETFSRRYFLGRVSDLDRDRAQIKLLFTVGDYEYQVVRGLFDTGELRFLKITKAGVPVYCGTPSVSFDTLHASYSEMLAKHMGVSTFQQFVFLQHFLLTFDERRSLTFWEPQVLQEALFLAFGKHPELAAQADQTRRQVERLGSIVRNLTYQATETRKKLRDVESALAHKESQKEDLVDEHRSLGNRRDDLKLQQASVEAEIEDKRLSIEQLSATRASLHTQYEDAFAERAVRHFGINTHPLIVRSLADHQYNLCGQGNHIDELTKRSQGEVCPLCGGQLPSKVTAGGTQGLEELKQLDAQISQTRSALDSANEGLLRLEAERIVLQRQIHEVDQQLSDLESENRQLLIPS